MKVLAQICEADDYWNEKMRDGELYEEGYTLGYR